MKLNLNFRFEIYADLEYQFKLKENSEISYDQTVHAEFSVHHSEKIFEMQEQLKHFHFTIPECWLSKNADGTDIIQILIKNG